ncbi:hypothetical protein Goklo_011774 [Gossypium klotzschianum]|uniref:NAD-dependent epimerase/dehydratase domain-containing protein n=1 Tax=Gossypium klotzschianum TaxID=34286 RepID=A0A7J8VAD7_9ROSI|nr:hypothetical protein [Gossypium klotzschianum]
MEICQLSGHFFSGIPLQFNHRLRKSARTPKFLTYANGVSCYQTEKTGQDSQNRMFILGMGFVGQFFAEELRNEGWIVSGTCTSMKKRNELQERGLDVLLFDANQPEMGTMNTLKSYTHLLVSIPPIMGIDASTWRTSKKYNDRWQSSVALLFVLYNKTYLAWKSTVILTGVYGDCGGACVDEDFLASPTNEMAKLRLVAEQGWLNLAHDVGIKAHVFRLGGIYGPGRSAVDTIIKQGPLSESQKRRVAKQFTSRVHVADICQALKASIRIQLSRRIYNIVDDDPASRKEVFAYALDLVEKKWPSLVKEITSHERAEPFVQKTTLKGEKRVSNAHMKNELAVQLLYPSYKSGLQSIVDQIENPF